jgi:hypothetical protein
VHHRVVADRSVQTVTKRSFQIIMSITRQGVNSPGSARIQNVMMKHSYCEVLSSGEHALLAEDRVRACAFRHLPNVHRRGSHHTPRVFHAQYTSDVRRLTYSMSAKHTSPNTVQLKPHQPSGAWTSIGKGAKRI